MNHHGNRFSRLGLRCRREPYQARLSIGVPCRPNIVPRRLGREEEESKQRYRPSPLCGEWDPVRLWHVRRYSTQSFLEPYAIYVATLVLWAYSIGLQLYSYHEAAQEPALSVPSGMSMGSQTTNNTSPVYETATENQIHPDALTTVVHLDRPVDDELVQLYIRWGGKMTARLSRVGDVSDPPAPQGLLEEGHRILGDGIKLDRDVQYSNNQSDRTLNSDDIETGWGIRLSFAESLNSLLQASRETQ